MTLPAPFLLGEAPDRCAFFLFLLFAVTPASSLSLLQGQQQPVQVNLKASGGRPAKKKSSFWESHFSNARWRTGLLSGGNNVGALKCYAVTAACLHNSLNIKLANLLESFGKEGKRN